MHTHGTRWVTLRSIFGFTALLAMAGVHAQTTITIRAANSVNDQILGVQFAQSGGTTTVLNSDAKSLFSLESLVLVTNPNTFSVDLFAADNQKGEILDYVGDFCAANPLAMPPTPACSTTGTPVPQAAAIRYPNGLSADTAGQLFLVDNQPGKSPQPQVWVVPVQGGSFQSAVQIDTTSPAGSLGKQQAVVETMIVGAPLGTSQNAPPLANTGDLLVVSNSPDEILIYPGQNGIGPIVANHSPGTLIPQCSKPGSQNCIPAGSSPQGIAVWPADNSLLITTSGGSVLRFSLAGGSVTSMTTVSGLPSGLVKIKTGLQSGAASAFIAQSGPGNHGSILELVPAANGNIQLQTAVTAGVAAPQGITVTNATSGAANSCETGCNLLGGGDPKHNVLTHIVHNGSLQGSIIEDVCIVPTELRPPGPNGACNDKPQVVNAVCPGFDNTGGSLAIPGYLCGSPGFALVRTLTTHAQGMNPFTPSEWNGTYVESTADLTQLLPPGANNPVCGPPSPGVGIGTLVWAPLRNEGTIFEGPIMVDITDGCGTGHGGSGFSSLWAIGLAFDTTASELQGGQGALENFARAKYTNKIGTINTFSNNGNITNPAVLQALYNNNSNTSPGCIDISVADYVNATTVDTINTPAWVADMQNAANLLTDDDTVNNTTCDNIVVNNPGSFAETPSPLVLNPSGQIRSRLANTYYTINTDILGNPAPAGWPPQVSVSASVSPQAVPANTSANLVWGLKGSTGSCNISTTDPDYATYNGPSTATTSGSFRLGPWTHFGTFSYTFACPVPDGTVKTGNTMSVSAHLTVWQPVLVTTSAPSVTVGSSVQIDWTPPAAATGCTLISNGGGTLSGTTTPSGTTPYVASYQAAQADIATGVTFTANCTFGASPGSASIAVKAAVSPAIVVSVPSPAGDDGFKVQVTWTPPAGATGCTLSGNGTGTLSGTLNVAGPATGASNNATYKTTEEDPRRNGGIVTFTAICTAGASSGSAQLTVNESP
jgi:hypothetical protein